MDTVLNMLKGALKTAGDYLIRKEALLEVLQGGDPDLLARAKDMVRAGRLKLNGERWVRLAPREDVREGGEA